MTPLKQFKQRWSEGCGSCQCDKATNVVFCRGTVPADVLFIGEAPGVSEDILGSPFKGPAGKLLDGIVEEALERSGQAQDTGGFTPNGEPINTWAPADVTYCFTNLVGCLPSDDRGVKSGEPDKDQITKCRPRLIEFIKLVKPKIIVCVGSLAEKHVPFALGWNLGNKGSIWTGKMVNIVHPAFILRAVPAQQSLLRKQAVVRITNAIESLTQ